MRLSHILYLLHLHLPADKVLVRAVMSAQGILLLHHSVSAGAARPHHFQPLQAAHGDIRAWWGQLHCISHPGHRNVWVASLHVFTKSISHHACLKTFLWCNHAMKTEKEMNAVALTVLFSHLALLPHFTQTENKWLLKPVSQTFLMIYEMSWNVEKYQKLTSQVPTAPF